MANKLIGRSYLARAREAEVAMRSNDAILAATLYTEAYKLGLGELEHARTDEAKNAIWDDLNFYYEQVHLLVPREGDIVGNHSEQAETKSSKEKSTSKYESSNRFERRVSGTTFDDIAGMYEVKKLLTRKIIRPLVRSDVFDRLSRTGKGKIKKSGVILYGPPGCGKTYIAESVAGEASKQSGLDIPLIMGESKQFMDKWVGGSQKIIDSYFRHLADSAPAIGFIDEIEEVGGDRTNTDRDYRQDLTRSLLKGMDDLGKRPVLLIGATNLPWMLDPALIRSGRFSKPIFVPAPDMYARKKTFEIHLRDIVTGDVNLEELAYWTEAYSNVDIKEICNDAVEIVGEEIIDEGRTAEVITQKDLLITIRNRGSSLLTWAYKTIDAISNSRMESILKGDIVTDYLPMLDEAFRIRDTLDGRLDEYDRD